MPSTVPQRGVRLDDELYDKVRKIAEKETRSFNQEVVFILRQYVAQYETENGEIVILEES